jgi:hypothetical protein
MYKMPAFIDALFAIILPFMSQKFKDRVRLLKLFIAKTVLVENKTVFLYNFLAKDTSLAYTRHNSNCTYFMKLYCFSN